MKKTPVTYKVTIDPAMDMPGFLDMLRYEQGQVQTWDQDSTTSGGRYLATPNRFTVTIRVDDQARFQPDRWRSFGIVPFDVSDPLIAFATNTMPVQS